MSETAIIEPRRSGPNTETVLIVTLILLMVGIGWYALSQRQQALRNSAAGLDGLQIWLSANGVSAQSFSGGWQIDQNAIGLLILPIYDTLPGQARTYPQTKEELLFQQDENDALYGVIHEKARRVDSLIVLPKWRSGMRLTKLGHPVLRVEFRRVEAMLRKLTGKETLKLRYSSRPFTDFPYQTTNNEALNARIYAAQVIDGAGCSPVIGRSNAVLLAACGISFEGKERRVLILSDPDLLNNHGLRLGDNAAIAKDFLAQFASDRNIIIDYSRDNWMREPRDTKRRERSWADLRRFFSPPFTILWLGAALLLGLFVWRAALRYGPVKAESTNLGAGKLLAIHARARLMRLSDQDGAMIKEYAKARLAATTVALLGPAHARHNAGPHAFVIHVRRRHPDFAEVLETVLAAIDDLPPRISAEAAIQTIDKLERVLEQITHDT